MSTTLQKITTKARQIRRNGEPWTSAIKRASKVVMASLSPSKKAAKKKPARKKVGATKKKNPNRQTGGSNLAFDKRVKAKAPGKRVVKHRGGKNTTYTERRKNRSDQPGKLTGVSAYNQMLLNRMQSNNRDISFATARLDVMKLKHKQLKPGIEKKAFAKDIDRQKKYIASLKSDTRMLKALIS